MTWGSIQGPVLLIRGLLADRGRPDLEALARERDPERFVWRVLPHAARSFAASIVVLPGDQARAAAVAYLYCRMLDTYEDLISDPDASIAALRRFSARFGDTALQLPTAISEEHARDQRDRVYLLLLSRCALVDAVFRTLPADVRGQIADLVDSMAEGMAWSTEAMARQGGTLRDADQLALYCRNVIGHPAVFTLRLIDGCELSEPAREDAFRVSEMIQLANVSRDIERDLARGIAYHPALEPYLGSAGGQLERRAAIRYAREQYLAMALARAPAYRRLFNRLDLGRDASVRTAAVLMLLFTDLHYRSCARRTRNPAWPGPRGRLGVVAASIPALVSKRWARRALMRVETDFGAAAARLAAPPTAIAPPSMPRERSSARRRFGESRIPAR
jgi:phytoene/squalene synthetase